MKQTINKLLSIVLSFAMILTGFTFLGGAAAVNADDIDNTTFTVKVVDEQGDPVQGVAVQFEASKVSDNSRERTFDVPISRPGGMTLEEAKEWNPTDANGEIKFDLNDEDTPFIDTNDDYAELFYTISANSDSCTTVTAASMSVALDQETWGLCVDSVNGETYDGSPITITVSKASTQEKPGFVYFSLPSDIEEFQPASGGTYVWVAMDGETYAPLYGVVDADDFKMQSKNTASSEWSDASGYTLTLENSEDEELIINATLPDNTDDYDKDWRLVYKHCDVTLQYADCERKKYTQLKPEAQVEKPAIGMVMIDSASDQPATGGSYKWAIYGIDDSADFSAVTSDDFGMQVKVGDGAWTDTTDATVSFGPSDEYDGLITATVPDNTDQVAKQWRFTYAGEMLDFNDEPMDAPAITQAAAVTADPEITGATVAPTQVDKYSDEVTVSVTGSNLEKVWYRAFRYNEEDDYWYRLGSGYTASSVDAKDSESAEIKFAPADESGKYRIYVMSEDPGTGDLNVSACDRKYMKVEWTVKADTPQPNITGVFVDPTEVSKASDAVTVTVNGANLDKVWYVLFYCEPGDDFWMRDKAESFTASSSDKAEVSISSTKNADKFRIYVMTKDPGYTYYSETSCKSAGFSSADWTVKEEPQPSDKPVIGDIYIHSANEQPAAGGSYEWAIYGIDDTADFSAVTSEDFGMQVKVGDGAWTDTTDATVTFGPSDEYDGIITATVPDNTEQVAKQWRFTYAGEMLDYSDNPMNAPAITQAAAEAPVVDPAVEAVVEKINALPAKADVTAENKDAITEARTAYDALNDDQKAAVDDEVLAKLTDAEAAIKDIEDAEAAKAVADKISALPAKDEITSSDKAAVEEAKAAYDALTEDQKAKVGEEAVAKLNDAEKAVSDAEAVDAVTEKINALPDSDQVTAADKAKIEEAKAAYDALTDEQKAKVNEDALQKLNDNVSALEKAENNTPASTDTDKAAADKAAADKAAAAQKAAEEKAKATTSVEINSGTVNAATIQAAIAAAGGRPEYVTELVIGKKVKKISKKAFAGTKVNTLIVKSKKLKKKSIKGSLKGSAVKTIKVKVGKAKTNKKFVKKYKKIFTKKNAGKKVKVKK